MRNCMIGWNKSTEWEERRERKENFLKIYYAFLTFVSRIKDFEGLKFRTSKLPYFPIWMNLVRWWPRLVATNLAQRQQ